MPKIINFPDKQDGQFLNADEVNIIQAGVNQTYTQALIPSHALDDGDFVVSGTAVIDGVTVPVIKINPTRLANLRTYNDSSQFDGDGSFGNPYKIKASIIGGGGATQLATPTLQTNANGQNGSISSWAAITNATGYILQRATNSTFTTGLTTVYTGALLTFTDTGLTANTLYYYRLQATSTNPSYTASSYSNASITTQAPGATTPAPPTVTGDDTANTLTAAHALGLSEIVVSLNDAAYVQLTAVAGWNSTTSKIDVGNVARPAGYWKFKIKAATGRNESSVVNSPAFTVAAGGVTLIDGFTDAVINNGLLQYNAAALVDNQNRTWTVLSGNTIDLVMKYQLLNGGRFAIQVGTLDDFTLGLVAPYQQRNKDGIGIYHGLLYGVQSGQEVEEAFVGNPTLAPGNWVAIEFDQTTNNINTYISLDGVTFTLQTPQTNKQIKFINFVSATVGHVALSIAAEEGANVTISYPQIKTFNTIA